MKKNIFCVGLICIVFFIILNFNVYAFDDQDFQVWNTDGQEMKVGKSGKLMFEEEFRWGDNASKFYYQHYDVGYAYSLNKYFSFGGGFRYIKDLKGDKFRDESQPYFVAFEYWNPAGFSITNRNRLEYRSYDYQVDSWRFRNKLDIKSPWKFTKFEIQPVIADEIFLSLNGINLNENRLYVGLAFALTKKLKGEVSYMLRSTKNVTICTWKQTNVLSIKLKYSF